MWDEYDDKKKKKFRKITKGAAYSVGIGFGLWMLAAFYPKEEDAETLSQLFFDLGLAMIIYGFFMLAIILFKRQIAFKMHLLCTWVIMPTWIAKLAMDAFSG